MKFKANQFFIVLFTLVVMVNINFAQGAMKGTVVDSLTNEPLFGANVFIMGTGFGAATNIEGTFRINNVPPGNYTTVVSYIGYKPKEYEITIVDQRTLELDATLSLDILESEEVVITAQAKGQVAAINQQLNSNTIVNVISEEKIQELPDANAAESIGRLPGVSVIRSGGEANKIILRGLGDQYTNVTIDGIRVPSSSSTNRDITSSSNSDITSDRGIDLSGFSQSSLAGIELYKALTADKDADAIAGSVNLVTKKAPKEQQIRIQLNGGYNDLMSSMNQYDFSMKYGNRFFDDIVGLQVTGNVENKIRSNERTNFNYTYQGTDNEVYNINDFFLYFTDEVRTRNGASVILDFNTPDEGNIKFNNTYYSTKRDYITHSRDYTNGGGNSQTGGVTYQYRDREQEISTFTSSLTGDNHLFGFDLNWGISFAQSISDFPFDYEMNFTEPSITGEAGARPPIPDATPEQIVGLAYNNFLAATLSSANYRTQHNVDKNKAVFLNILKDYSITNNISGSVKIGGKYKSKSRNNDNTIHYSPYYLGYWQPYESVPGEGIVPKDLSGTYFDAFFQRYQENPLNNTLSFQEFLDDPINSRVLMDNEIFNMNPLINRDKLRQWYELNKNGISQNGGLLEYYTDPTADANYYDITETVSSAYVMNTLNIGQNITFIAGLRVESEDNDYRNKYSRDRFAGFPVPIANIRDTTSNYSESIVLPNFHLNLKITDFMNIRLAAFKALARPDFNMRLNTFFAWRPANVSSTKQLFMGNPKLKTAKAWNYEINTSFYGNEIGLITVSAFYKEITDMYHMLNQINTQGNALLERLDLEAIALHDGTYQLTIPYNSPGKSKVWGFEFEHQINFTWLPGILQNLVLSYNASLVRSETTLIRVKTDTTWSTIPGIPFPIASYNDVPVEKTQPLEKQPKLFGNISLGYDIAGFTIRLSLFHQSEYTTSYSPKGLSDRIVSAYTRLDLALKYKATDYLNLNLNINNLTNIQEDNLSENAIHDYQVLRRSERYGLTADFGIQIDL